MIKLLEKRDSLTHDAFDSLDTSYSSLIFKLAQQMDSSLEPGDDGLGARVNTNETKREG